MSHEMTMLDQMYSVRIAPWHIGMGTNVLMLDTAPESRPERMALAGHDFIVEQFPIYRHNGDYALVNYSPIECFSIIGELMSKLGVSFVTLEKEG